MGHTDPALALRVYRQAMRRGENEKAALRKVVDGPELPSESGRERRPRLRSDSEDDERDPEPDDRVGDGRSESDHDRRSDHRKAYVGVRSGVVSVGDERSAIESSTRSQTNAGR